MALELEYGVRQKVFVSHVADDGTFFVQLDTDVAYGLADLSQKIGEVVEADDCSPLVPEYGLKCYAFSPKDQTWYRALINEVDGTKITVYYVDYGNTEEVPKDNLKSPAGSLPESPYQAVCCSLSDFIPLKDGCHALTGVLLDNEFSGSFVSRSSQRHPYMSFLSCNNLTVFQDENSTESLSQALVTDGLGQYRICTDDVKIGSRQNVYTCFHDSPGKFWVQLSSCLDVLSDIMDDLNDPNTVGRLKPLPSEALQPGVACCCQYIEDNRYHRAEVMSKTKASKKFKVSFVDYGNCEVVEQSDIKELPPRLALPPFFAIQCCLDGVTPVKQDKPDPKYGSIAWNQKACDAFVTITEDKELDAVFVSEFTPEIFNVKLVDPTESNTEIAHLLAQSGHANLSVEYTDTPAPQTDMEYQYLNLDVGKTYKDVFVTYADSPSVVWCQLPDQLSDFEALVGSIAECAPNLPPCVIAEVDQPCCVKYDVDDSWCRGLISSVDNEAGTAQVLFVDYGNTETIPLTCVKEPLPEFFSLPAQAVSFSLAEMSPVGGAWSQGAIGAFQELAVNQTLTCEVVGLDEDGYPSAKLVNHLQHNMDIGLELIRQGHAKAPLGKAASMSNQPPPKKQELQPSKSSSTKFGSSASHSRDSSRGRDPSPFQSKKASPAHSFSSGEGKSWSRERHASNRSTNSNSSNRSRSMGSTVSPGRSSFQGSRDHSPSTHRPSRYRRVRLQTGEAYAVTVCHVESLNEFYCQLRNNAVPLSGLMQKIDQHCNSSNARPVSSPRPNMPVLAKFSGDGVWYRAIVKQPLNDKGCRAIFVDYGNSETVSLDNLIEIPSSLVSLESQAIQCALIGVPRSFDPPESTVDAFVELAIDNDFSFSVKVFVKDKELNVGELFSQDGNSLLDQLVEKGLVPSSSPRGSNQSSSSRESQKSFTKSTPSQSPKQSRQTQSTSIPLPRIPLSESVDVISSFTGTPTQFYLQLSEDYLNLEQLTTSINDFYSKAFDYEHKLSRPVVGDFCAAKFSEDNLWYRARITNVSKAGVEVVFVDYGNSETTSTANVKVLQPQFARQPCIAIPCSLAGLTTNTDSVVQRFVEKITDCQLVAQFQQPFSSFDHPVPVKLFDTSVPDKDVDIAKALAATTDAPVANSTQKQADVQIAPVTPVINSPMECVVSFVVSPGEFYCQLTSETGPFDNLMNKLYAYYGEQGEGVALSSTVIGAYCAAPYSDGSWYRGRITDATPPGSVSVHYIDYGNTDKVETEKLCELSPEFYALPAQALKCQLVSLSPASSKWSDASTTKFQEFVLEGKAPQVVFMSQLTRGCFEVQLSVEGKDASQLLVEAGLARMQISKAAATPTSQNLTIPPYPATKGAHYDITVTFAESPHEFFCQVLDREEKLDALMIDIDTYCQDPSSVSPAHFTWKSGDFALAQFSEDGVWYRAHVSKVLKSGTAFEVHYIDYGNSEIVSSSHIRPLKPQFCKLPCQSLQCRLNGSEVYTCSKDKGDEFNNIVLNIEFEVTCASVSSEGVCSVDMKRRSDSFDVMGLALDNKIFVPKNLQPQLLPAKERISSHQEGINAELKVVFPNDVTPDSFHDVTVSHVESPSLLFCQFSLYMAKHLDLLMNSMQDYYTSPPGSAQNCLDASKCKVGMFAAGQYSADDLWYRALVTAVQKSDAEVYFIDFGNSEVVPFSKLKQLSPEFAKLPAQAIPCSLSELAPVGGATWSEEVVEKLFELVYGKSIVAQIRGHTDLSKTAFIFGKFDKKLEISLIDSSIGIDSELISRGLAIHVSPSPSPVPTQTAVLQETGSSTKTGLSFPKFSVGQVCETSVSHIDSPSSFWIQLPSADDDLAVFNEKMSAHYTSDRVSRLSSVSTVGSICCAKYSEDDSWYRGVVKSASSDSLEVCFVDYGNSEIITPADVKILEPEFQALPVQAIECKLHNCLPLPDAESWSDDAIGVFSHLVLDKDLSVKFVGRVDNVWEVEVSYEGEDVTAQLLHTGLVASLERVEVSDTLPKATRPVDIPAVELQPGHTYPVYITFNDAPNKFYCQLVSDSDKLESLMAEIADFYNGNHLEPLIEVNAYCVAQYSGNSAWYRAKILSVDQNGEVEVQFIDYGNSEHVLSNQILALESRFVSLPAQAFCCTLMQNVSQIEFSASVLDAFFSINMDQEFKIKVSGSAGERHLVDLFDPSGFLINDTIVGMCDSVDVSTPPPLPTPAQPPPQPQTIGPPPHLRPASLTAEQVAVGEQDRSEFRPLEYRVGQTVDVYISHVDSPTSFYCQPLELTADLDNMMSELGAFMSGGGPQVHLDPASLKPGQVCVARYSADDEWYRAKVEGEVDGGILVTFVDYGNCEVTNHECIAQIPREFLSVSAQTIHCSVFDGLDANMEWSIEQVSKFQSLIPESDHLTLKIGGVSGVDQQYYVEISSNGEKMEFSSLLEQQIDQASAAQMSHVTSRIGELNVFRPISQDEENSSGDRTDFIQPSAIKTESESGETEESDSGSEGKPLIKAPFKLSLAVAGETVNVTVVYVQSPSLLYVQRVDCQPELVALSDEIEQYCASFGDVEREFLQPFHSGDFVLAKFDDDGLWYRAEVIGVDSDGTAKVTFIDYGNEEIISPKDLMMCPENLLELPVQAIPCCLAKVPRRESDSWPSSYKELIDGLVTDRVLKATVELPASQGMITTITLEDVEAGEDIAQSVLAKLQDECEMSSSDIITEEPEEGESPEVSPLPGDDEETEAPPTTTDTTSLVLPTQDLLLPGTKHEVFIVSCASPLSFMCQLASASEDLDSITASLAELYASPDEGNKYALKTAPTEGDLVVALFSDDGQWYRAVVTECSEDGASCEVSFIDYGNSETVAVENLRAPDPSLATQPPLAFECFLSGVEVPSESEEGADIEQKAAEEITAIIGEDSCIAEIVTVDDFGRLGVTMTTSTSEMNIGSLLVEAKLVSVLQKQANTIEEGSFDEALDGEISKVTLEPKEEVPTIDDDVLTPVDVVVTDELQAQGGTTTTTTEVEEEMVIQEDLPPTPPKQTVCLPEHQALQLASTHEVYIVSCRSPQSFICQLSDNSDALDSISTQLVKLYSKEGDGTRSYSLRQTPKEGDFVVALFSEDEEWYRAVVTKSYDSEKSCEVTFVDYGNCETVAVENLCAPDPSLATQPPLAFECFLSGVETQSSTGSDQVNSEAVDEFLRLVNDESCSMEILTIEGCGRLGVVLTTATGINVGSSLVAAKLVSPLMPTPSTVSSGDSVVVCEEDSTPSSVDKQEPTTPPVVTEAVQSRESDALNHGDEDIEEPLPKTPPPDEVVEKEEKCLELEVEEKEEKRLEFATSFTKLVLEVGSRYSAEVVSVSTLEEFVCRITTRERELRDLMDEIGRQGYKIGEEDALCVSVPKKGLPVAACFTKDNCWHRGEIQSLGRLPNTVNVLYVDRGDVETVSLDRVRHLEKRFAEAVPTQCVTCALPILTENDLNTLPLEGEPWELVWPVSSVKQFSQLTKPKEEGSGLYLEVVDLNDDGVFVVKVMKCLSEGEEVDVRNALVEKIREPKLVQFDDSMNEEDGDFEREENADPLADTEVEETLSLEASSTQQTTEGVYSVAVGDETVTLHARTPTPQPGDEGEQSECATKKEETSVEKDITSEDNNNASFNEREDQENVSTGPMTPSPQPGDEGEGSSGSDVKKDLAPTEETELENERFVEDNVSLQARTPPPEAGDESDSNEKSDNEQCALDQARTPPPEADNGGEQARTPPPEADNGGEQARTPPPEADNGGEQARTPPPEAENGDGQNEPGVKMKEEKGGAKENVGVPAVKLEPQDSFGSEEDEFLDASQDLSVTESSTDNVQPDDVIPDHPMAALQPVAMTTSDDVIVSDSVASMELVNGSETDEDIKPCVSTYLEGSDMQCAGKLM